MGYVMIYESAKNNYLIKPAHQFKSIDTSKINDEVRPFKQNIWVCKTRQALENHIENQREQQIKKHMEAIQKIQQRTVTIIKQRYNHA
ncbi:hypothetical protein [Clostridium sp.]|uniref:hypothetical protein n=1 Tax=Clostridium sp. TaxID=1506 RepID=UPI002603C7B2|nr:hypothetical protein [Clostridium sp.]